MSQYQRPRFQPPEPYSISRGTVTRIEPYGCFVRLASSPVTGLVHISQLHSSKTESVTDVVTLDDEVWVKVVDVQVESIEDDVTGRTRQRHRVKLSMKHVNQDTGKDLDPDNEGIEGDLMQRGGGGGGNRGDGTGGADTQLGKALASNIGMGSAIDPGNLILKAKRRGGAAGGAAAMGSFNGYALVGEEEGEEELTTVAKNNNYSETKRAPPQLVAKPMGRGRGTTLPAWMTRSDPDDRLGSANGVPGMDKNGSNEGRKGYDSGDGSRDHKSRKRDKHHRKERHGKHSRHGDRNKRHRKKGESMRRDRRRRGGDRRSRSRSRSSVASRSRSGSCSRSPSEGRRRRSRSRRGRRSHRRTHRDEEYSCSGDRGGGASPAGRSLSEFANMEEARAVLERLEQRR